METIGLDQYGQLYRNLGDKPRAKLAQALGVSPKSLRKMYQDKLDGSSVHAGYIAGGRWVSLYRLQPVEKHTGALSVRGEDA